MTDETLTELQDLLAELSRELAIHDNGLMRQSRASTESVWQIIRELDQLNRNHFENQE